MACLLQMHLTEYYILLYLKIYKIKQIGVFLLLCSPVNLAEHSIYALCGRLEQFFKCY